MQALYGAIQQLTTNFAMLWMDQLQPGNAPDELTMLKAKAAFQQAAQYLHEIGQAHCLASAMEGIEAFSFYASEETEMEAHTKQMQEFFAELLQEELPEISDDEPQAPEGEQLAHPELAEALNYLLTI